MQTKQRSHQPTSVTPTHRVRITQDHALEDELPQKGIVDTGSTPSFRSQQNILALQRTIGNQATIDLLQRQKLSAAAPPRTTKTPRAARPNITHRTGVSIQRVKELIQGTDLFYETEDGKYYRRLPFEWGKALRYEEVQVESLYLVGEGDFTYASGFAKENPKIVLKATSFDPEKDVLNYPGAEESLRSLKQQGVPVQHRVNAMNLEGTASPRQVDVLQFNFPHTGTGSGKAKPDSEEYETFVRDNQALLKGFFRSAHNKVKPDGKVKVTYKKIKPYTDWHVEGLAQAEGWVVESQAAFAAPEGYRHVLTKEVTGEVSNTGATTVTFVRDPARQQPVAQGVDPDLLASKLATLKSSLDDLPVATQAQPPRASASGGGTETVSMGQIVREKSTPPQPVNKPPSTSGLTATRQPRPSGATAPRAAQPAYRKETVYEGTIVTFKADKGYGFIRIKGSEPGDIFFHVNALSAELKDQVKDGKNKIAVKYYKAILKEKTQATRVWK